jgi:hypothetical protein
MGGVGAEEGFQIGNAFADDCEVSGFVLQANGGEVAGTFDVPASKFPGGAFSGIGGHAKQAKGLGAGVEGAAGEFVKDVVDSLLDEAEAMVHAGGTSDDFEMGEMAAGGGDEEVDGFFVADGNDKEFGVLGTSGVEDVEAGGIAGMDLEAKSASEFDVFGVGFEDDRAEALRAKEAADVVAVAAEASEDDRRRVLDGICFPVGGGIGISRGFEPIATGEKGEWGESHGEGNDGIEAGGLIEGEDAEASGLAEEDEGKLTALEHGKGINLKTEMAEGESAAVIGPTKLPASRVASSYRCNRCEPGSLVEPSTTPSSSLSISVSRIKRGGAGGELEEFAKGGENRAFDEDEPG